MTTYNLSDEFRPLIADSVTYALYDFSGELEYRDKERLIQYLATNNIPWTSFREDIIICEYKYKIPEKYLASKIHILMRPNNIVRMSPESYSHIRPYLQKLDGTWCEQLHGYLFAFYKEDPREVLLPLLTEPIFESDRRVARETFQYYPTPAQIARRLIREADIAENDSVLEPSAGQGDLLDYMPVSAKKTVIEINDTNVAILKEKGYTVLQKDFLGHSGATYDKIVMNPPFSNALDVKHIQHAYSLLRQGGTLVAIINENILYFKAEIYKQFRQFLRRVKYDIQCLPVGAFKESGTSINTCILKIYK